MKNRIPLKALKRLAKDYNINQIMVVAFSKAAGTTHVATYGRTTEEGIQAAHLGNRTKQQLGFPDNQCRDMPKRATKAAIVKALPNSWQRYV